MSWPGFSQTDTPLDQLVKLSHYYGLDVEFVIAGGGNTSVKTGDRLFVKASGTSLADIMPDGFVELSRSALDELLAADLGADPVVREERFKHAILAARVDPGRGQRPSVECVLHGLFPARFVVHTHSTSVNWLACARDGGEAARTLFGDEVLWIPYVDPGYVLARSVNEALTAHRSVTGRERPRALLMQNHGIIVGGDTPDEVRDNTDFVVGTVRRAAGTVDLASAFGSAGRVEEGIARRAIRLIGPLLRALLADAETLKAVRFDDSEAVMGLVGGADGRAQACAGAMTPDQIVYCNSFPLWFEPVADEDPATLLTRLQEELRNHCVSTGYPPKVIFVSGLGMFCAGESAAEAETVRLCAIDAIKVAAGAGRFGGARPLPERERRFIETWEVESYRRKVAAAQKQAGRLGGKVAMVTGAAQGFGREIAEAIVAEGGHVVAADINGDGVAQLAADLAVRHGPGRALGLAVDVTSEQSVDEAVQQVVRAYGGLDILISNAGVLRAGSVQMQPLHEFEQVTRVNYTGYFICVQKTAPVMALQHRAKPGCRSDIIQINSKSGLAGSNRNGAYAGSKFGGIGLTQSFALELIDDGIKVNSVCPGNYFDGPLWSDPETGLFVQYLRTGKVPGARTIADVRHAYEAKVPMRRGCTTADVMKAICYLVEQQYETGQAVPVTGGQIMLH
jgi:rhamnose utilization protein RhaD (predicted bifunctional aldolase and dehydrogenase)/NAD(P)-dependent dehydrogenase (short-subunit alcohol dehydrogenase family)